MKLLLESLIIDMVIEISFKITVHPAICYEMYMDLGGGGSPHRRN